MQTVIDCDIDHCMYNEGGCTLNRVEIGNSWYSHCWPECLSYEPKEREEEDK